MARLTPRDIQEKEFSSGFRGYKEEEVDEFLDRITSSYEEVFKENIDFKEEVERLSEENKKYELIGERMQAALVAAQETADDVRKNATKEAENILREAEIKAHKMVQESRDQHRELQKSLAIVKQIEEEYRFKLKSTLQSYLKLLDEVAIGDNKDVKRWILPEDMAALGERRREMEEREAAPKAVKTPPAKKEEAPSVVEATADKTEGKPATTQPPADKQKIEEKKPEDTAPMIKPAAAEAPTGKAEEPKKEEAKVEEPKVEEKKAEEEKAEAQKAAEKAEKESAEKASKEAAEKAAAIAAEAEKAAAQKSEAEKKAAQLLEEIAAQAAEEKKTEEVKEAQKAIAEKAEEKKSGTTQPPAKAAEAQKTGDKSADAPKAQAEKVPFDQEAGKASAVSAEWANLQQAVDEAVKATDKPTQAEKEAKSAESTMPGEMVESKPAVPAAADKPMEQPKKAPEPTEAKAKAKDEVKEEKTGKSALEDIEIVEDESFWKDI